MGTPHVESGHVPVVGQYYPGCMASPTPDPHRFRPEMGGKVPSLPVGSQCYRFCRNWCTITMLR